MAIKYDKLFELLKEKGYSSNYWLRQNGIHPSTVMKLKKNQTVTTDTINTLCGLLEVQPGELMEYILDKD